MCAHTVFFLHDTDEGPKSLCLKPFVKTTPTRGEKLISSQNDTKFARTKWGVGSSLKSNRYPGYVSKRVRKWINEFPFLMNICTTFERSKRTKRNREIEVKQRRAR